MRRFTVLLRKELRELLTLQVLAPFAVSILVFVLIGNIVGQEGENKTGPSVTVVDADASDVSRSVIDALESGGFKITLAAGDRSPTYIAAQMQDGGSSGLVIGIPRGFGADVSRGTPRRLESHTVMRDFSFLATRDAGALKGILATVNDALSSQLIVQAAPGSDPSAMKNPVGLEEHVVVGDRSARASAEEVIWFISNQTTFIPIVLFLVIVFAAQIIATTIASEKENKTLETLLASPIGRGQLVTAKMVAAATIALVSAAAYMIGLRYYMDSVAGSLGGAGARGASDTVMASLGLTLGPAEYALLGASLFAGTLVALAAAVILGAFAENIRAIQSLLTPLIVFIMIPYFLTLFIDLETASPLLRWSVLAIPFAHPFRAAPSLFLGDLESVWAGIAYETVWFIGLSYIAARIFSSDRILTLKLSGRRRVRP